MEVTPDIGYASPPDKPKPKPKLCPNCNQPWVAPTGWKAMFRKPTTNEWTILIMLIGVLIMTYAYFNDTQVCRDFQNNPGKYCQGYVAPILDNYENNSVIVNDFFSSNKTFNISNRNLTANVSKEKG
jgi:hypothetical protein